MEGNRKLKASSDYKAQASQKKQREREGEIELINKEMCEGKRYSVEEID